MPLKQKLSDTPCSTRVRFIGTNIIAILILVWSMTKWDINHLGGLAWNLTIISWCLTSSSENLLRVWDSGVDQVQESGAHGWVAAKRLAGECNSRSLGLHYVEKLAQNVVPIVASIRILESESWESADPCISTPNPSNIP